MARKATFPVSLDPITNGHINIIERVAPFFDELVVVVAVHPEKNYLFSAEERAEMARAAVAHIPNVSVDICAGQYVVKYTDSIGAQALIRGLRSNKDLEYERDMAQGNRNICPRVETLWIPCLPELMHVSSSMVKGLVGIDPGWEEQAARWAPPAVVAKLKERFILNKARKHWDSLMKSLGNPKNGDEVFDDLISRYREAGRFYHTLEHIVAMLDEFETVRSKVANPDAVRLAIWFHDAIYDTKSKGHKVIADNEARSAFLAETQIAKLGLPESFGKYVAKLISATSHTEPVSDPDSMFLVDLDLVIFGRSEKEFDAYETGIRKEYDYVPEPDFRRGRSEILQSFLDRPSIYLTQVFRDKYEVQARKNLERSIKQLQ